jgi:transcriptional regulator GlxA family with amidase domain
MPPIPTTTRTVAVLVFDGFQALDAFGPLDAFDAANGLLPGSYRLQLWSLQGEIVRAENGIRVVADRLLNAGCRADTMILPGGAGARALVLDAGSKKLLSAAVKRARRVASICTGAFLAGGLVPAASRIATHWKYADDLRQRFPDLQVDADVLYLRDGKLWSSAGVTAGIDLALSLIADDLGSAAAIACARQLVVHYHRAGNQAQFSDPLQMQQRSAGEFGKLLAWMLAHPQADLSLDALAERAGMSARHLTRRFSETFGESPGRFAERVKLDHARTLLMQGLRIEQVAEAAGFRSADAFRRAFERRFSVQPSAYRQRFGGLAHAGDSP